MAAPLKRAFGVYEDVCDILDIAHFVDAAADFQQRIVGGAFWVGWIEQKAMRKLRAPSGGERPVFTLDVMDDGRMRP